MGVLRMAMWLAVYKVSSGAIYIVFSSPILPAYAVIDFHTLF